MIPHQSFSLSAPILCSPVHHQGAPVTAPTDDVTSDQCALHATICTGDTLAFATEPSVRCNADIEHPSGPISYAGVRVRVRLPLVNGASFPSGSDSCSRAQHPPDLTSNGEFAPPMKLEHKPTEAVPVAAIVPAATTMDPFVLTAADCSRDERLSCAIRRKYNADMADMEVVEV